NAVDAAEKFGGGVEPGGDAQKQLAALHGVGGAIGVVLAGFGGEDNGVVNLGHELPGGGRVGVAQGAGNQSVVEHAAGNQELAGFELRATLGDERADGLCGGRGSD